MMKNPLKKQLFWDNAKNRSVLIDSLKQNDVSITSTDTIYGFLSNSNQECYQKIADLKQVKNPRPFLLIISSALFLEKLSKFIEISSLPKRVIQFLELSWPGPLTVIFKARPDVPEHIASSTHRVASQRTIAVRIPDHTGLQEILLKFNALFSTSANISGETPPEKRSEINPELVKKVSFIVSQSESEEEQARTQPSSIIDLSSINFADNKECDSCDELPFRVIREGAYSIEKLKEIYAKTK